MYDPALAGLVTSQRREDILKIVEGNLRDSPPDDFSQRVDKACNELELPMRRKSGMGR
jgi:hypothetical protein